ncbi:hypothetical protein F5Y09DRAFT_314292 [Xylaria sp. FL1042]|nr:hypothetical protein F5Y09DRAFT_314292 [Xylaria sp. FL1042]
MRGIRGPTLARCVIPSFSCVVSAVLSSFSCTVDRAYSQGTKDHGHPALPRLEAWVLFTPRVRLVLVVSHIVHASLLCSVS